MYRPDILFKRENPDAGIIIELKKADSLADLDNKCEKALVQIHECRYEEALQNEGWTDIWLYGIAFYKKRCRVMVEKGA